MPTEISGLPAHVLLIHLIVVVVPVAALVLIAQAWSRAVRRWAGVGGPLLCLVALILVPITSHAGGWLRDRLRPTPLIEKHAQLGNRLLPWVIAMLLVSIVVYVVGRRPAEVVRPVVVETTAGTARLQVLVAVLATVIAVGSAVQTYRVGESGARAVWAGSRGL